MLFGHSAIPINQGGIIYVDGIIFLPKSVILFTGLKIKIRKTVVDPINTDKLGTIVTHSIAGRKETYNNQNQRKYHELHRLVYRVCRAPSLSPEPNSLTKLPGFKRL